MSFPRLLASAAMLVILAPTASAQFSAAPLSGWTNSYGRPIEVKNNGDITGVNSTNAGTEYAFLGATNTDQDNFIKPEGNWLYAAYNSLSGLPAAIGTGSVSQYGFTVSGTQSMSFDYRFLMNLQMQFEGNNNDFMLIRLLQGGVSAGPMHAVFSNDLSATYFQQINGVDGASQSTEYVLGDPFFTDRTPWLSYLSGPLAAGSYSIEVGVINQNTKNFESAVALDNFALTTDVTPIPEPGSVLLMATGLLGLALTARSRRRS